MVLDHIYAEILKIVTGLQIFKHHCISDVEPADKIQTEQTERCVYLHLGQLVKKKS